MGAVICSLKPGELHFPPDARVIKGDDYLACLSGREIVEQAERRAREIVAAAEAVYEREKARGYEEGLREASERAAEQIMDTIGKTVGYFAGVEEQMVQLVLGAVRKILGELDDRELIVRVVHHALNVVRNQKQVILRVAPDQVDAVRDRLNEILVDYPGINFVDVAADGRLGRGGCILESDIGIVDASVEVQLEALRRSLVRSFQHEA